MTAIPIAACPICRKSLARVKPAPDVAPGLGYEVECEVCGLIGPTIYAESPDRGATARTVAVEEWNAGENSSAALSWSHRNWRQPHNHDRRKSNKCGNRSLINAGQN